MFLKAKAVLGILFLLALAYTALWYTAGFNAQKEAAETLSRWRDDGYAVEYSSLNLSGFPYRFVIELEDVEFKTRKGGLSLKADEMVLVSHLWTPGHWISQTTNNRISLAGGLVAWDETYLEASYRMHDTNKLVIKIDSAGTDDMTLHAPGIIPPLTAWTLLLGRDEEDSSNRGALYEKRTLEFKLYAETAGGSLDLTGGVSGPTLNDWTRNELVAWRDAGGLLEVDQAQIATPDGGIVLKGDVSLDENLRLLGAASIVASSPRAVQSLLSAAGRSAVVSESQEMSLMLQNGLMLLDGYELLELGPVINQ